MEKNSIIIKGDIGRKYTFSPAFSCLNLTIKVSLKWSRSFFKVKSMVALGLGGQNLSKEMCQSNLTEK